jgi:hypothetical protein
MMLKKIEEERIKRWRMNVEKDWSEDKEEEWMLKNIEEKIKKKNVKFDSR